MPTFVRPSAIAASTSRSRGVSADERVVGAVADHELGDDLGIERRAAASDPPQRVHELADVADAVLEQVADAAGPVGEQLRRVLPLDVLAEHEDRRARHAPAGLDRRPQALVALGRRHPHVDDRHVGPVRRRRPRRTTAPSPTFATTVPPDSSISRAMPSRMSAESSAMTTRSGAASTVDDARPGGAARRHVTEPDARRSSRSMRSAGAYRGVMDAGLALSDIRVIGSTHGRATVGRLGALLVAVTLVGSACSPSNPEPSPTPVGVLFPSSAPTASPAPSAASSPARTPAATLALPDRPLASAGQIAVVRDDGSLWLTDAGGRPSMLASGDAGTFGFPTWSPDGSQIAAVQTSFTEATILVFDVGNANSQPAPTPRAIFRSATIAPFYLSWTPDGTDVSFLASDAESLKLWLAPADGSAPLDGSGPGAVVRAGNPFYFDWIDGDHLFAHIGTGADAFLGEIGRDGVAIGKALRTPGVFRSADVSADGKYVGYVRAGASGKDAVVVTTRNGADEHSMPVFGLSAVDFSPVGDTLASIGAVEATTEPCRRPRGAAPPDRCADRRRSVDPRRTDRQLRLVAGREDDRGDRPGPPSRRLGRLEYEPGPFRGARCGSRRPDVVRRRRDGRHPLGSPGPAGGPIRPGPDGVLRPVRAEPPPVGARQLVDPAAPERPGRDDAHRRLLPRRRPAGPDRR